MNFRTIALGFYMKDRFRRAMEIMAVEQQMLAKMSMVEIAGYLRGICPKRRGMMASLVRGWDFQRKGTWGFEFFVGWRASQFSKVFYPPFVLHGTGLYGFYGKPIKAFSAPRLAWQTAGGKWVSKLETKGQKPKPILKQTQDFGIKLLRENVKRAHIRAMRFEGVEK